MIRGHDVVCISSIDWDFLWQSHQEVCSRLARAGNRVLYVENTGVRAPAIRDARRVVTRLSLWSKARRSRGVREVAANLYVCSPLVLPAFGPAWRRALNRLLFLPSIRRAAASLGMRDVLLWTYLPTDTAADLIRLLRTPRSAVVYYCVDNFTQLTPHTAKLDSSEKAVCEASDLVFAVAEDLATRCRQWNPHTHLVPNGVNLDAFTMDDDPEPAEGATSTAPDSVPDALSGLPRPIVGYVGGIHRYMNFGMLADIARARPEWSWVFVGPLLQQEYQDAQQRAEVSELTALPNVHLVGRKPHRELAAYVRSFDVCIVPYVNSPFTDVTVPTKVNEYLAVGKPVVSTELTDVCKFNEQHEVLLTAPNQPDAFLEAIEQALELPNDEETARRRREVATLVDWNTLLEGMSVAIEQVLESRRGPGR